MRLLLLPVLIGLCGCAVIAQKQLEQEYQKAMEKCNALDVELNVKALLASEKPDAEKKAEFARYPDCIQNANATYYPEYAHLWNEHTAEMKLIFAKVLEGKLTPEEANVLTAKSYSSLNQQASLINNQNQQLEMQRNAQIQQQFLNLQALQQQPQQQFSNCTHNYNKYSSSINSTCW